MPNNLERATVIIKGVETSVFRRIEADPEKVKSSLLTGKPVDFDSFASASEGDKIPSLKGKLAEEGDQRMTSHHSVLSKRFV